MTRLIRSIAPLVLMCACSTPLTGSGGGLSLSRQLWERQGIDDYRFVYTRVCFCPDHGPVLVTVRDDRVVEVRDAATGNPVPSTFTLRAPTVDELFDWIGEAEARGDYLAVEYHPRMGYPTSAEIGTLANDAGSRHLVGDLVPLE